MIIDLSGALDRELWDETASHQIFLHLPLVGGHGVGLEAVAGADGGTVQLGASGTHPSPERCATDPMHGGNGHQGTQGDHSFNRASSRQRKDREGRAGSRAGPEGISDGARPPGVEAGMREDRHRR